MLSQSLQGLWAGASATLLKLRRLVGWNRYLVVRNVFQSREEATRPRALLLYRPKAFRRRTNDPAFIAHQNMRRCRLIAAILEEMGYIVDAASARDQQFASPYAYDLVLSDRANPQARFRLQPGGHIVLIGTTIEHSLHNQNLERRHALLHQRRGQKISVRRRYSEELPLLNVADAIICVGNRWAATTWRSRFAGPIYEFNNHGFPEIAPPADGREFAAARRHFLYFASRSQMQKGLDLLLEVFARHPNLHLHICSSFAKERDFCAVYRRELYQTPNIHPVGWIEVNSSPFRRLVAQCAWVIHPTCSEGQAGSVVQCMHAGLIPIVTREAGIDTGDFGVLLAGDSLDELSRAVTECAAQPPEVLREGSVRVRQVALEQFSEQALLNRWRQVLAEITGRVRLKAA